MKKIIYKDNITIKIQKWSNKILFRFETCYFSVNLSIKFLIFHSSLRSVIVRISSPALIIVLPFGVIDVSPRFMDTTNVFSGRLRSFTAIFSIVEP